MAGQFTGSSKRVEAHPKSSNLVVNSVSLSRDLPVFTGFFEIIRVVYDEYFKWLLKSKSYIKALQGTSDLVRDGQALRYANFAKVYLPEIPLEEQKAIADYINNEVTKIDNSLPTFQEKIELLREYRTRLISGVVTGQFDVRDVVIPEYTPEDDTEIDVTDTPDDTEEVAEDAE